ncbi:hypothetical protein BD410DRAFT_894724 [Rickenella mellea]|uniref:Uncharacterized protein n=1 Tax=Rickenella mellea TaxID=50990 RepID=A0A4Y7QJY2_9AGAM|nr:hypothetical protein BD410DRAFT_894724 [Rickenella mellea]
MAPNTRSKTAGYDARNVSKTSNAEPQKSKTEGKRTRRTRTKDRGALGLWKNSWNAADLPADILLLIFNNLRDRIHPCDSEMTYKFPQPTDILQSWIYVTHVCQRWRQLALGYSPLWTSLSDIQSVEEAETYISRSKGVPLEVFTYGGRVHPSHATVHTRILRELPRTRHVTVLIIDDGETTDDLPTPVWEQATPCLESITFARGSGSLTHWETPVTILQGPHPALRSLSLHRCYINWGSSLLKGLSNLYIDLIPSAGEPTMMEMYAILSACPELQRLVLQWACPRDVFTPPNIPRVHFPHLHTFDIAMDATKWAVLLSLLELPGNVNFGILCHHFPFTSPTVIVPRQLPPLSTSYTGMSNLVVSITPTVLGLYQGMHGQRRSVTLELGSVQVSMHDSFRILSDIIQSSAWTNVTALTFRFFEWSGESANKNMWINVFQTVPKLRFFIMMLENCEANPDAGLPEALCSPPTPDADEEFFLAPELIRMELHNVDISESIELFAECFQSRFGTVPLAELILISCKGVDKELLEKNIGALWIDREDISFV